MFLSGRSLPMATAPKSKSAKRKKRRSKPPEAVVRYVVEITGLDWSYTLLLSGAKYRGVAPHRIVRHHILFLHFGFKNEIAGLITPRFCSRQVRAAGFEMPRDGSVFAKRKLRHANRMLRKGWLYQKDRIVGQ